VRAPDGADDEAAGPRAVPARRSEAAGLPQSARRPRPAPHGDPTLTRGRSRPHHPLTLAPHTHDTMKDRRLRQRQRLGKAFLDGGGRDELVRDASGAHSPEAGLPLSRGPQLHLIDALKPERHDDVPGPRARRLPGTTAAAADAPPASTARPATPDGREVRGA